MIQRDKTLKVRRGERVLATPADVTMSKDRPTEFELDQDCGATVIPGGQKLLLRQGERVKVKQALGGSLTVQTEQGYLVRIDPLDAAKIWPDFGGTQDAAQPVETGPFQLAHVLEKLKTVFDPEIPVNVVDLGLIYVCEAELLADGGHRVQIKMSMTAPGCGMGDVLKADARDRVQTVPGVSEVDIELVWDPPWDASRMSDAARLHLGMY